MMDFGTMNIDFCEPISLKEFTDKKMINENLDPFKNNAHQMKLN